MRLSRLRIPIFDVLLALLILLLGVYNGSTHSRALATSLTPAIRQLQQTAQSWAHQPAWQTALHLFVHNGLTVVGMVVLGAGFAVFPVLTLFTNGLLIGFVCTVGAVRLHTTPWHVFVVGMLPHGIFELSAIVWGGAIGIRWGLVSLSTVVSGVLGFVRSRTTATPSRSSAHAQWLSTAQSAVYSIPYLLGLLVLAAAIEATVTPYLIHRYL